MREALEDALEAFEGTLETFEDALEDALEDASRRLLGLLDVFQLCSIMDVSHVCTPFCPDLQNPYRH